MKRSLLLDTSAWFAALNPRQEHHERADRYYRDTLAERRLALVTTNLVVAEMHALIMTRGQGAAAGLRFLERLQEDARHEIVWVTRELERHAVDRWLRSFGDDRVSLTDAVSFEVMRQRGVPTAFTLDQHFAAAGFQMVP